MNLSKSEIVEGLIYPALDEILPALPNETEALRKRNEAMPLMGAGAALDSMGLLNLIVGLEEALEKRAQRPIRLVDDKAMSRRNSPFRTVATLAEYIEELLNETSELRA